MLMTIRRFCSPFFALAMAANAIGTLVIFALVAIMNYDVIARGLFHQPLKGAFEIVVFSLALIVYLQLPDVVRSNRLTRSDGFLLLAQTRMPGFANLFYRAIDLLAGVFMALIAWTTWPEFVDSIHSCRFIAGPEFGGPVDGGMWSHFAAAWNRCEYYGTPGIFTAPWFPIKFAIAFSVTLCAIIFAFKVLLGNDATSSRPEMEDSQ